MENEGEMMHKLQRRKNAAVAGVIEALLMVALVAIVLSIIQIQYIPQVMQQREAEHMDQVSNQFSTLKSMIDLQAITGSSAPISSMLTLGSREIPYFITAQASGDVSVVDQVDSNIVITDQVGFTYEQKLTSITYQAYNVYFVQQTYALEGGGIIVTQPGEESVMRSDPSLTVINGTNLQLTLNLPIFRGIHGKNSTTGTGICFIRTNYSEGYPLDDMVINEVASINISTLYPNAWYTSLHDMLEENVNYHVGSGSVEITKKTKSIVLSLQCYDIYTQIGPGWIK